MADVVNVIGSGAIGGAVINYLQSNSQYSLGQVLTRKSGLTDPDVFFSASADIVIEAAGSPALQQYGPQCLERSELWTVSACALVDPGFCDLMGTTANATGNRLRLFSDWFALTGHISSDMSATVHFSAARPGLAKEPGVQFAGPLREAAKAFPNEVNSAVAAALCGPGIDNATIELASSVDKHFLNAEIDTGSSRVTSRVDFPIGDLNRTHPTAIAIIAGLERRVNNIRYG